MSQTREAIEHNLAERWCGEAARREDSRVARRLYRKPVVDGVYRLDAGALRDAFFHGVQERGGVGLMARVPGTAIPRARVPVVQSLWRDGLKTLLGMERRKALPAWLCSDAALRRWVGFKAPQVRHGVCQRGAATRQGPRTEGPLGPAARAHHLGPLPRRALEAGLHGPMRALARAGILGAKVTGMVEAPDLETTAAADGGGQGTRPRKITATRGQGHAREVTVFGWKPIVLSDAPTKRPLAVTVVPSHAHAGLAMRARVTQAHTPVAGSARRPTVVCDPGWWEGVDLWWLDQPGLTVVVPAKAQLAVTVEARAPAAAGAGITHGRRVHTRRPGPGKAAWTERLETAGVGITGLRTADPDGTPEPGRHHHRRDFEPHPIHAVVIRTGHKRDDGPGGHTGCLTTASVPPPRHPGDDAADRRRIEPCGLKAATPRWDLGQPPQNTGRAGRGPGVFTGLRLALATAYRRQCAHEDTGGSRWAGGGGGASSSPSPGPRASCGPRAGRASCSSRRSPCC